MGDVALHFRHMTIDKDASEIVARCERIVMNDNLNAQPVKKDSVHKYEDYVTGAFDYNIDLYGLVFDGSFALLLSGKTSGNADDESSDPTEFTLDVDIVGPDGAGTQRYQKTYANCIIAEITDEVTKDGYLIQHMKIRARGRTITSA